MVTFLEKQLMPYQQLVDTRRKDKFFEHQPMNGELNLKKKR